MPFYRPLNPLLKSKTTGLTFRGSAGQEAGVLGYWNDATGAFWPAAFVEAADDPGAVWHSCSKCGWRWVSGMHGGHDCLARVRDEVRNAAEAVLQFMYQNRGRILLVMEMKTVYDRLSLAINRQDLAQVLTAGIANEIPPSEWNEGDE